MSETQTYTGSCHCGAVKFTAQSAPIASAMSCNCSICRRAGTLLAFVPEAQFTLDSGADSLISYKFNKHVIDHVFCRGCGIKSFARQGARRHEDDRAQRALSRWRRSRQARDQARRRRQRVTTKRHVPAFARDFEMQVSVGTREFVWGDRDAGIKRVR
jgi:hypothetical protein